MNVHRSDHDWNRREFLSLLGGSLWRPPSVSGSMPNLLFIFSDQHRACTMPGEHDQLVDTPHLTRLMREGTTVRNCLSNYPVCSPYRGMLLTGRWPCQTGIIDNSIRLKPEEVSLGEVFRQAGYRTGYIGKWHLQDRGEGWIPEGEERQGFEDWQVWYNTNVHYDRSYTFGPEGGRIQPSGYNATLMTDAAVSFIEGSRRPWMLMLSWNPPHPVFGDAPPELMLKYPAPELRLRPNVPSQVHNLDGRQMDVRADFQGYCAHIEAIDRELGRLLQTLERTGQKEQTVVIYTSDHGEMMGAQGRMGKRLPHDESCRVPFVVRYPGIVPAGRTTSLLLSTIDLFPSLCGLSGITPPSFCKGSNLAPQLRGETAAGPESVFLMHIEKDHASHGRNHPAPIFRGLRTRRYTYAVGETGRWCLFDDQEDPYQRHNLAADSRRRGLMSEFDGEIRRWLSLADDRFPFPKQG